MILNNFIDAAKNVGLSNIMWLERNWKVIVVCILEFGIQDSEAAG